MHVKTKKREIVVSWMSKREIALFHKFGIRFS